MYFPYFIIISPWKKVRPFIWTNLSTHYPRIHCAKFGWNWPSGSGEEDFLNFVNVFSQFSFLSPLGKEQGPSFEENWIPYTQGCFVPSLVENGQVVLEKKSKLGKVYWRTDRQTQTDDGWQVIRYAHLSFQVKWAKNYYLLFENWMILWFFTWTKLNPLNPRMLCAKFDWNRPSGSGEEEF